MATLLLALILGAYGGFRYSLTIDTSEPVWRSLGQPPDEISELLMVDTYSVYVLTSSNKVYSCYWESPHINRCWIEAHQLPEGNLQGTCDDHVQEFSELPAWGQLVDAIVCINYASWAGRPKHSSFSYALLADGTVLQRLEDKHYRIIVPQLRVVDHLITNVLIGCFIGVLVGIGVASIIVVRSRIEAT